ncbi:polyketide cyclase [Massilia sp. Root351]|jgi:glyoxylase-like metal-dependent hydrolase (beta-lactamase superfamily II)|uniref:MBL fold metallo-hydrolase n=1 Tax=Massilia sp. Root351 TaxID=1736522 RepID=UPI000709949E|nr:MBL fold metallo-hydrolase [Massilia sp. Root351]KQV90611.1 polyketide cyclase [Massilia sp. Root351]
MNILHLIALAGSLLAAHARGAEPIWDGNQVDMVSEKLADGVYAYYASNAKELNAKGGAAATSGGLVVGAKGALLVDTMLNKRLNSQVQALSRRLGHKPILYAVNTSSHGDHTYGNMYLPAQTIIIQHAQTRSYLSGHLDDDKAFMIKHFGTGRGIEQIQARAADLLVVPGGRLTLDLGGKTVDIIDFGFAQTGGDLWVWEPQAKVLWTGNPVIAHKPALPWLLDGHLVATLDTLRRVYAFLPADARVVPGHGVPMGKEDIKWHIDYLDSVRSQVQAAVDKGLGLDETVKQVAMPEFSGYALFDWVHPALNVPAAYQDLSGK